MPFEKGNQLAKELCKAHTLDCVNELVRMVKEPKTKDSCRIQAIQTLLA